MSLSEGSQLGPYEIQSLLGAGGMGEVYRARDTRLDRTVAVKVLPAAAADRPDLRERLSREARAVSSLNHPHICALYDVGHEDGVDFLVMEYLEGETLAERLTSGPLPLDDVLRYAMEIGDALASAHREGLIHRDLKPGNIMLTATGAKLLDFGLAKAVEEISPAAGGLTQVATATSPLTADGSIVGTFQYMAPELLAGKPADARSDIFAFGAVVYEMATGRRAFDGTTQATLVAAILKEEPRSTLELAPSTPPALERLLRTCLAKNPDERRQTMSDVLVDLRWVAEGGEPLDAPASTGLRHRGRERLAWGLAIVALAAALVFGALWTQRTAPDPLLVYSSIVPPPDTVFVTQVGIAVSPDGRQLAFVARTAGERPWLWIQELAQGTARRIEQTAGAEYPFWSPDSRDLGFFADGKLKRVPSRGGAVRALTDAPSPRGGSWGPDGTIVYGPDFRGALFSIPASGGEPSRLTELDSEKGDVSHRWPWFLPDGRTVLFLAQTAEGGSTVDDSRIETFDLESGQRRTLVDVNASMQFVSSGHLLYWSQNALWAQAFDPTRLELSGEPTPITDDVEYTFFENAIFSSSDNGLLVFHAAGQSENETSFVWYDASGTREEGEVVRGPISAPRFSHDGKRLAFRRDNGIWIADLSRNTSTRLTFDGNAFAPTWSPDDEWIAYSVLGADGTEIRRKKASGLGGEETLHSAEARILTTDWSPDGSRLHFIRLDAETDWDNWVYSFDDGKAEPLIQSPHLDGFSRLSPDGEWLVYNSSEGGIVQIIVQRLTGPGGRWQVSREGGQFPSWSADGKRIYYLDLGASRLFVVEVELGETLQFGHPQLLIEAPFRRAETYAYDLSPDGRRLIVNQRDSSVQNQPLTLVHDWTRLLD